MSEPLFAVPDAPAIEPERVTERTILNLLAQRYTRVSMNAHRYAYAEHVPTRPGFADRIADFVAVDCYGHGGYGPLRKYAIHGHEVKVSRSDWLTELRDPTKAEAFRPYCHHWWLVVGHHDIVRDGELPAGWGLMAKTGGQLRAIRRAPRLDAEPMPAAMTAALLRATAKTARRTVQSEGSVAAISERLDRAPHTCADWYLDHPNDRAEWDDDLPCLRCDLEAIIDGRTR